MIPGVIGGAMGAYVLSNIDAAVVKPFILAYLTGIGIYLLIRAWRHKAATREPRIVEPWGSSAAFWTRRVAAAGGRW
ncbi:hypothetical protein GCM10020258_41240 [Sphingomonas yabuuchiae]